MLLNDIRIAVIDSFLGSYRTEMTGSDIAKRKKLNQKSAANALRELEKEGFLKSRIEGKNRLYFLNLGDAENIINFVSALEHIKTIRFYKKNTITKEFVSKADACFDGIVAIFGSYAKGLQKEGSDLDIFIAGKCNDAEAEDIAALYNIELSIKKYPHKVFQQGLAENDLLIEEIIKSHIIVKNTESFVKNVLKWKK